MKYSLFLGPLAVAVAGAGALSDDTAIPVAPEEGTTLTRAFVSEAKYAQTAVEITVNGEEMELEGDLPDFGIASTERIVVTDTLGAVEGGHPLTLSRTFDELAQNAVFSSEALDKEDELTYASALQGATVLIAWDEEDEEYGFTAGEDEEIEDGLLEHLTEDMDFRAMLPDGEVAEEDSWDITAEAILPLIWPAGNLQFNQEDEEVDLEELALETMLIESLEGKGTAVFGGIREEDDRRLAVITFTIELTSEAEQERELEDAEETQYTVGREIERTMEGELLWDVEAGHMHSLTAESEVELDVIEAISAEFDGNEFSQQQRQTFTGTVTHTVTVERE